jgi:nucleotide-binding universal stress UspA family protein
MIGHVLIPLDGSEMAESLLERLPFLTQSDVLVTLLCAVDPRQQVELMGPSIVEERVREADEYLTRVVLKLRKAGARVRKRVERGVPAETILEIAEKEEASLICMSTHGRSGIGRMMYGSVTEKVVRASIKPVLVVPSFDRTEPEGGVDRREWKLASAVVALDGSRQALQVVPYAAGVVELFGSKVTLLLVLEEGADEEIQRLADKHLAGATELFEKAGVKTTTVIRNGDPAMEIVDYTPRYDHDLIMMTTHGRSGLSRWMLGSVTEKVIRTATVPVLVVRSVPDEKEG